MAKRRKGKGRGVRADGRSERQEQFAMVKFEMTRRAVFRTMIGAAKAVLLEIWSRYDGRNNGDLSLSYGEAAGLLAIGKSTAARAFRKLEERGFACRTSPGYWYGRKAATWRLTMLEYRGAPPTCDYRRWQPGLSLAPIRRRADEAETDGEQGENSEIGTDAGLKTP